MEGNSIDNDDGCDTDEWDSSDSIEDSPTKLQQQFQYPQNKQTVVRTKESRILIDSTL